jgi:hypothetical protein
MAWPQVARSYMEAFQHARDDHSENRQNVFAANTLAHRPAELPELNLNHLASMTDATGLLQHAAFTVPRFEDGYCLDDNARGLVAMAMAEENMAGDTRLVRELLSRYLAFAKYAFNDEHQRFRNFMTYHRTWVEEIGSEDSHGRGVWGLGTVVGRCSDPGHRGLAHGLFHAALPAVGNFESPRALAFCLLGIDEYLRAFEGDSNVQAVRRSVGRRLFELFETSASEDWPWFEDRLTYCNARLSQALIATGSHVGDEPMLVAGLRSLEWLVTQQRSREGYFAPIGSNGFYVRAHDRASFDQQPIEAAATVAACAAAQRATGERVWATRARHAFNWFIGQNELQQFVYDPATGGCHDALHEHGLNENQGAESTLAFVLALLEMRSLDQLPDRGVRSIMRLEKRSVQEEAPKEAAKRRRSSERR